MPISYAFSLMTQLNEQLILDGLRQIKDPDLHKDIVTLGFIRDLKIDGGNVSFRIVLTTPACPVKAEMESAAKEIVSALPGVTSVAVTMDAEVPKGRGLGEKLVIEGVRVITFSGETQYVTLHGVVRADDVTSANKVSSNNVADVRVEFISEGSLTDAQKRGWLTKLYDLLRPY